MWQFPFEKEQWSTAHDNLSLADQLTAWAPYLLILVFILFTSPLFPALNYWLK